MTKMEFHELANLFPLVSAAEIGALAKDILANGLQQPIVTYEGKILDGRNRYRACKIAKVEPRFEEYTGTDPLGYVVSLNLKRRHLDESQQAMVASRIANLRDGQRADRASPIGEPITQSHAAEMLNVGKRSVERARKVLDKGAPELVEAVESGNIAVSTAAALTKLPAAEQRAAASRPAEAAAIASRLNKEKRALDESPAPSDRFRDVAVVKAPVRVLTEKEILEVRGALASFAMAGRRIKLLIDSEALGAIVNLIVLLESRLPPRKQGSAADGLLPPGQAA